MNGSTTSDIESKQQSAAEEPHAQEPHDAVPDAAARQMMPPPAARVGASDGFAVPPPFVRRDKGKCLLRAIARRPSTVACRSVTRTAIDLQEYPERLWKMQQSLVSAQLLSPPPQ